GIGGGRVVRNPAKARAVSVQDVYGVHGGVTGIAGPAIAEFAGAETAKCASESDLRSVGRPNRVIAVHRLRIELPQAGAVSVNHHDVAVAAEDDPGAVGRPIGRRPKFRDGRLGVDSAQVGTVCVHDADPGGVATSV